MWDLETGRELRMLEGRCGLVSDIRVSRDGRRAVSASDDQTPKVWGLETGETLATFTADAALHCCLFVDTLTVLFGDGVATSTSSDLN